VWLDASGLPDGLEWWFEPNPLFIPAGGFNISCLIMSAFEHIETGLYEVSVSVLDYETLEPLATTPFLLNITPAAPVRAYDFSRPGLVPDDQHERIAWGTHWCTPTAIGICLWGFRAFREKFATKEDLIDAVGKALGTHPFRGTRSDQIKPRLEQFFRAHGVPLVVKEYRTPSFNDMLREFVENREDVSFCVDCRHRVLLSALDRRKTGATWRGEIIDPATGTRVPVAGSIISPRQVAPVLRLSRALNNTLWRQSTQKETSSLFSTNSLSMSLKLGVLYSFTTSGTPCALKNCSSLGFI